MKTAGIIGYVANEDVLEIDIRTIMAIEFTKALLSNPSITNMDTLGAGHFSAVSADGLQTADELIKQLNEST